MIFSHVKISYFLRVFKYDFSQWPKTLYNTYVYIINHFYYRCWIFYENTRWDLIKGIRNYSIMIFTSYNYLQEDERVEK